MATPRSGGYNQSLQWVGHDRLAGPIICSRRDIPIFDTNQIKMGGDEFNL